ncbi:hypothetical protein SELMODRAFT_432036 [Selaginella moellendorffii]|uniref:Uncharacterized protein n=1 Tax=Selaginella moellendorffii TaxID=88036 RepID=D8TES3_SELML|nr:hypothetical protein SELMODRAFT_432036 [Selaginella moellendorffii]
MSESLRRYGEGMIYVKKQLVFSAISRCLGGLNPSELSIRLRPDKGNVFHPLSLNYTTSLSCRTWDELVQELSCIYSDAIASLPDTSLPEAKTRQNAAIIQGIQPPKDEREPTWMSKLSEICRGRINVDLLLCHKFMLAFSYHLDMNDSNVVSIDKEQDCQDLITQEEEELYIDRHLPRAQADEIVCKISQVLPQSYRWLGLEEMDSKEEVFRVINWDVEGQMKSTLRKNAGQGSHVLDESTAQNDRTFRGFPFQQ